MLNFIFHSTLNNKGSLERKNFQAHAGAFPNLKAIHDVLQEKTIWAKSLL